MPRVALSPTSLECLCSDIYWGALALHISEFHCSVPFLFPGVVMSYLLLLEIPLEIIDQDIWWPVLCEGL